MYVFLLNLRGFLVESEARNVGFSDLSGTEPAWWTPSTHQLSEWSIGGLSEEGYRSSWRTRGSWSLWSSEKLILSQNYWKFKGLFGEQSLAGEFIPCSTACLRRNFGFNWCLTVQAKLKLLPCPISQIPAFFEIWRLTEWIMRENLLL